MNDSDFNANLLKISNQLSSEDLEKIKFLCQGLIGKKDQEKISSGQRLFQLLTERGKLGVGNTDYLSWLLINIQRPDLSDTLLGLHAGPGAGAREELDQTERAKIDIATVVISQNVGRSWRKFGRKLGLPEVKLESISRRHHADLEETAVELLKEWRKSQGAEARTETLIKALRACEFNLTADKVEDKLKNG
ncbi:FAS-associated death domain protein isoform X2 [Echeneis naucrates]|uniref:FAS-associated death domain protein-like n=1 Tax=Echeneis naucrates TaxID=173247 RepID=A0A665U537_ECHNA|nr:FAS-associated death domain protein-like isoform X2 [Echeneis naucrates]